MIKYIYNLLFFLIVFLSACDSFQEDKVPDSVSENLIVVYDDKIVAAPGKPLIVDLLSNDEIYANATFSIKKQPEKGHAELLDGAVLLYTPNETFNEGTDEVIYQICSDPSMCDEGKVQITLTEDESLHSCEAENSYFSFVEMNKAKEIDLMNDSILVDGVNIPIAITLCDSPIEANSFEIISSTDHGTLTVDENGIATYTPRIDYLGYDQAVFQYSTINNPDEKYYALLELEVYDDTPCEVFLLVEDYINIYDELKIGEKYTVEPLDNDYYCIENVDFNSLVITSNPSYGTVEITNSLEFIYTLTEYTTDISDEFKYTLCDTDGNCYETEVIVNFYANISSCEFKAFNDNYEIYVSDFGADTTIFEIPVLNNDEICSNNPDKIHLSIVVGPSEGFAIVDKNKIKYTRTDGYLGTVFFGYRICNDSICDEAWVDLLFLE